MLIDQHVKAYVETNLLPQQSIRRLANGSIDYTYYDGKARVCRSKAFRGAGQSVRTLMHRLFGKVSFAAPTAPQAERPEFVVVSRVQRNTGGTPQDTLTVPLTPTISQAA